MDAHGRVQSTARAGLPKLHISNIYMFLSEISHIYTFLTLQAKRSAPPASGSSAANDQIREDKFYAYMLCSKTP